MRRRAMLLVVAMLVALVALGGVALAKTLDGGRGNDRSRVFNRPAAKDVVDCGSGFDHVRADRKDVLTGCNRVTRG